MDGRPRRTPGHYGKSFKNPAPVGQTGIAVLADGWKVPLLMVHMVIKVLATLSVSFEYIFFQGASLRTPTTFGLKGQSS